MLRIFFDTCTENSVLHSPPVLTSEMWRYVGHGRHGATKQIKFIHLIFRGGVSLKNVNVAFF
jgi:hypothetical protein